MPGDHFQSGDAGLALGKEVGCHWPLSLRALEVKNNQFFLKNGSGAVNNPNLWCALGRDPLGVAANSSNATAFNEFKDTGDHL